MSAKARGAGLLFVAAAMGACIHPPAGRIGLAALPEQPVQPDWSARYAVLVVVDGLRPDLLSSEGTPNLARLIREGATTLRARTVSPSATLPAHASLLTGLEPEAHGVTWNEFAADQEVEVPTVFDAVLRSGGEAALFGGKEKLRHFVRPGMRVEIGDLPSDERVMEAALRYLPELRAPAVVLVHLPAVDVAGHLFGWGSAAQRRAVSQADEQIGRLVEALEQRRLREAALVIVTADHGGHGHNHLAGNAADRTIPWIAWGGPVRPGRLPPLPLTMTARIVLDALGLPQLPAPASATH